MYLNTMFKDREIRSEEGKEEKNASLKEGSFKPNQVQFLRREVRLSLGGGGIPSQRRAKRTRSVGAEHLQAVGKGKRGEEGRLVKKGRTSGQQGRKGIPGLLEEAVYHVEKGKSPPRHQVGNGSCLRGGELGEKKRSQRGGGKFTKGKASSVPKRPPGPAWLEEDCQMGSSNLNDPTAFRRGTEFKGAEKEGCPLVLKSVFTREGEKRRAQ